MRDRPLVTVVLTSYNHARFIEEAVASALAQTVRDLEVVVVDDGSTDDSVERVQAMRDARVTVHRNACNRGRHSRNWAIRQSTGAFVAILNSDDRWHPGKLEAQLRFLGEHPDHGLCFTAVELCDDAGAPCPDHPIFRRIIRVEQHDRFGWLRRFFLSGNCLAHPSVLMRRDVLTAVGLYDPALFQLADLDLWVRAAAVTELAVLPAPLTTLRIHGNGGNLSAPSRTVDRRHARELTGVLLRYGASPILGDIARIFGLPWAEENVPDADRDVWRLAMLGRYAGEQPMAHLRAPAIHFLREALRRSDERGVLAPDARGRLALDLFRASGAPAEPAPAGIYGRLKSIAKAAVQTIPGGGER